MSKKDQKPWEILATARNALTDMENLGLKTDRLWPAVRLAGEQENELEILRFLVGKDRLAQLRKQ